jgi:hypothetical protein
MRSREKWTKCPEASKQQLHVTNLCRSQLSSGRRRLRTASNTSLALPPPRDAVTRKNLTISSARRCLFHARCALATQIACRFFPLVKLGKNALTRARFGADDSFDTQLFLTGHFFACYILRTACFDLVLSNLSMQV